MRFLSHKGLSEVSRRKALSKGFTLIELMITVSIIAVMAAMALPGIITAMADGRASDATMDVIRIGRRARSEATASGVAHVLVYNQYEPASGLGGAGHTVGRLRLYRGTIPAGVNLNLNLGTCNPDRWPANFTGMTPLDRVNLSNYNVRASEHLIQLHPIAWDNDNNRFAVDADRNGDAVNQDGVNICFQPDGQMLIRNSSSGRFSDNAGDVLFGVFHSRGYDVSRYPNAPQFGVMRRVVFTFGGNVRIQR